MTKRECAVIMAYTGIVTLPGDFNPYYDYIAENCGRDIYTHHLLDINVINEIKEKSKADFLKLCETAEEIWRCTHARTGVLTEAKSDM